MCGALLEDGSLLRETPQSKFLEDLKSINM